MSQVVTQRAVVEMWQADHRNRNFIGRMSIRVVKKSDPAAPYAPVGAPEIRFNQHAKRVKVLLRVDGLVYGRWWLKDIEPGDIYTIEEYRG